MLTALFLQAQSMNPRNPSFVRELFEIQTCWTTVQVLGLPVLGSLLYQLFSRFPVIKA